MPSVQGSVVDLNLPSPVAECAVLRDVGNTDLQHAPGNCRSSCIGKTQMHANSKRDGKPRASFLFPKDVFMGFTLRESKLSDNTVNTVSWERGVYLGIIGIS